MKLKLCSIIGYRLFAHDDKFTHKEYDLPTGAMVPASHIISTGTCLKLTGYYVYGLISVPPLAAASKDFVQYGFLAGDRVIRCFTAVCFR